MCSNHFCNKKPALIVFATKNLETFQAILKLSTPFGKYPGYPKTFQAIQKTFRTIRKISRLSGNFPGYPTTFQTIRKISRLSRNFPGYPDTFQAIQKLDGSSGKYPAYPETFQAIRKLSGQFGKYPDYLETFQRVRNSPLQFQGIRAKTFRTRKNFPGGNATLPSRFLRLCPTLPSWRPGLVFFSSQVLQLSLLLAGPVPWLPWLASPRLSP